MKMILRRASFVSIRRGRVELKNIFRSARLAADIMKSRLVPRIFRPPFYFYVPKLQTKRDCRRPEELFVKGRRN